ncbi:hypothetical protein A33M_0418 [Rhodovulum sp. PH10]|nr:hypothetical protein A33M_0418 [Rhodovulum sp. PH10]
MPILSPGARACRTTAGGRLLPRSYGTIRRNGRLPSLPRECWSGACRISSGRFLPALGSTGGSRRR